MVIFFIQHLFRNYALCSVLYIFIYATKSEIRVISMIFAQPKSNCKLKEITFRDKSIKQSNKNKYR